MRHVRSLDAHADHDAAGAESGAISDRPRKNEWLKRLIRSAEKGRRLIQTILRNTAV